MTCIDCKMEHAEKFCPNCGENANVKPITFTSMFESAFTTITNMDKGFLFNLKNLLLNPQEMISDYMVGKRKRIYNPISFLIITVTIYLIIDSFFHIPHKKSEPVDELAYQVGYESGKFIKTYLKYFWIFSIFWLSASLKLFFRKYSFAENLAISSFLIGFATLGSIISGFDYDLLFDPLVYLILIIMVYRIFSNDVKDKLELGFKSVLSIFLFFLQIGIITALIGYIKVLIKQA